MSEISSNTAVEQEMETVTSDETVVDVPIDIANNDNTVSMKPTYEQANAQADAPKKKVSINDILQFAQKNIFTPKVCSIILISLGAMITALCFLQMVFWGLSIKDTYLNYLEAIKNRDFINVGVMAFMLLFVIALFVNIIKGIVSLIKKGHETRFEIVYTIFEFCIFSMFVTKLFEGTTLLISDFAFSPILKILIVLTLLYAVVRLFFKDFRTRIWPLAFSCVAIVLSIVMYLQDIGDFAIYSIEGSVSFNLTDLDLYKYMQSVIGFETNAEVVSGIESLFFEYGNAINFGEIEFNETIVIIFLQLKVYT